MSIDVDLPSWRTLEDIYQYYLDETPSSDFPAIVADHTSLTWSARDAMNYASQSLAFDEAVLQKISLGKKLSAEKRNATLETIQRQRARVETLRVMVRNAMIQGAINGEWIALGRADNRKKHQLIPPGDWTILDFDIDKGTAERGQLRLKELRCAFTKDIPSNHQLFQTVQQALSRPHVIKNRAAGRPSNRRPLLNEFERRVRDGQLLPTLREEAEALKAWFATQPALVSPDVHTIENIVRGPYRQAKKLASAKAHEIAAP